MTRRPGGRWMLDVVLEDDVEPLARGTDFRTVVAVSARWCARHTVPAVLLASGLVAAVVGTAVLLPAWSVESARRALAVPAAGPGFILAQAAAPTAQWSAGVAWDAQVMLAGDTIVSWSPRPEQSQVVGLDLVTGVVRWRVDVGAGADGTVRRCLASEASGLVDATAGAGPAGGAGSAADVVCLDVVARDASGDRRVSGARTGPLVLLDAGTGGVVARRDVDGAVGDALVSAGQVVLVVARGDELDLVRQDVLSGREVWRDVVQARPSQADLWRLTVAERAGVVLVSGVGLAREVDLASGRLLADDLSAPLRFHDAALLSDGSVVASAYGLGARSLSLTSTLYGPDGTPRFTVAGAVREPRVADGAAPQLYAWNEQADIPYGGRVRAVDRATGAARWASPGPSAGVLVDVGGVAVLWGAGYMIGVDARTGAQLWREPVSINTSADLMTDGSRLLTVRVEPGGGAVLQAVRLRDGSTDWEMSLPAGVTRVAQLGTHLVAVGPGIVAALR